MSTISNVSSTSNVQYLSQIKSNSTGHTHRHGDDSKQGKDGGGLLGAIDSALKSAGISGGLSSIFGSQGSSDSSATSTDSTASTSTTDSTDTTAATAQSNFESFMQNLVAAIQSQSSASGSNQTSDRSSSDSDMPPPPPPPMGMGGGDMQSKLESLISKLSSSSTSSDSTSTTSNGGTSSTSDSTSTSATSNLEASFQNLLSSLGGSSDDSGASLQSFLKTLSEKLAGHGSSGALVSTTA